MSAPLNGAQEQQTWRGAAQMDDSANFTSTTNPDGLTSREIAQQYRTDGTNYGRQPIEKAALELGQLLASRSRYATTTDPTDTLAGYVLDADGHSYDLWVELGAIVGSAAETAQVQTLATAGDARAQAVLKVAAAVAKVLGE